MRGVKTALAVFAGFLVLMVAWWGWSLRCWSAWSAWDVDVAECPAGDPLLEGELSASDLRRGQDAMVRVRAWALFPTGAGLWGDDGWGLDRAAIEDFEPSLALRLPSGESRALECAWTDVSDSGEATCKTRLPEDIPDGQSVFVATLKTDHSPPLELEAEAGFYRPSRVHVLTDRPLYEPGDLVQFRALVLGEDGQGPLGDRPGRWRVYDADGGLIYEARGSTGPHGIADSDLPLAEDAPLGSWRVEWVTGADRGEATVAVRPFTLPRAELEAEATQRWFKPGEPVVVRGQLRSLSGVPLAGRPVELALSEVIAWPVPLQWSQLEPVETDANGRFRFTLEAIPDDLPGLVDLSAMLSAVTDAGDRVGAVVPVVLTRDDLRVDALTELGDGLVPDLSNRVYLKVMTPDGSPLPEVEVELKNRWDARDLGRTVRTDVDGVLSVNIDPGQPVQVLVPPRPTRKPPVPPRTPTIALDSLEVLTPRARRATLSLEEAVEVAEERCSWRISTHETVDFAISAQGGRIRTVTPDLGDDRACVARALEGQPLEDGLYVATLSFRRASYLPRLDAELRFLGSGVALDGLEALVQAAAHEAEACVQARTDGGGDSPFLFHWQIAAGERRLQLRRVTRDDKAKPWPEAACMERALAGLSLPVRDPEHPEASAAPSSAQGTLSFVLEVPEAPKPAAKPKATTTTAFEYTVAAKDIGQTTWRSLPGQAPPFRIRPDTVLLDPGQAFTVAALRGPGFSGDLPEEIELRFEDQLGRCPRTPEVKKARLAEKGNEDRYAGCPEPQEGKDFHLVAPKEGGFVQLEAAGARAVVYVRPQAAHSLKLSTAQAAYRPGETAMVSVQTGQAAIVSLTGVDQSLRQLAALPSPDALAELVLDVEMDGEVLGGFDALALSTGRVRGDNAAMATLQRVQLSGSARRLEPSVSFSGEATQEATVARSAEFAQLLGAARRAVAGTEGPLDYDAYAALWDEAAAGHADPFGQPLILERLPDELLELADPRLVVPDASRLPEDLEPWTPWVRRTRA